jgi:hypothetical protein
MKTVFTIGICLPGNAGQHVAFNSDVSLLDADIVLMRLDMSGVYDYGSESYQGKRCYGEHSSFELRERLAHWKRELRAATESGKTVFVLLNERDDVFVDSGQRTYSGTGRNMKTTRIVTPCSNYDVLPFDNQFTPSSGKVMVLSDKAALLRDYWAAFGPMSQYKAIIAGTVTSPLILSKDRKCVLGALIRFKGSTGNYVLLPDIDFDDASGLTSQKDGKSYWTKKATALGQQYLEALLAIDDRLRSESVRTPVPAWARDRTFDLAAERKINQELLRLEQRKQELQKEETGLKERLAAESLLKALLYEQGKPLEAAIIRALGILGFTASPFRDSDSEFDVVFSSSEGRFVGEAEGKDTKPINIDKLRQLEMNIHEDFDREGVTEPAKAVLFGNAMRLAPPKERGEFFTDKCLTAAKRIGCALVRTTDLFEVARCLAETPNPDFAQKCRQALFNASGEVVAFPPPTATETEEQIGTTNGPTVPVPRGGSPSGRP